MVLRSAWRNRKTSFIPFFFSSKASSNRHVRTWRQGVHPQDRCLVWACVHTALREALTSAPARSAVENIPACCWVGRVRVLLNWGRGGTTILSVTDDLSCVWGVEVHLVCEIVFRTSTARQQELDFIFVVFVVEGKLLQVVALHQWACSNTSTNKFSPSPSNPTYLHTYVRMYIHTFIHTYLKRTN
jgi:hypothetical protein